MFKKYIEYNQLCYPLTICLLQVSQKRKVFWTIFITDRVFQFGILLETGLILFKCPAPNSGYALWNFNVNEALPFFSLWLPRILKFKNHTLKSTRSEENNIWTFLETQNIVTEFSWRLLDLNSFQKKLLYIWGDF